MQEGGRMSAHSGQTPAALRRAARWLAAAYLVTLAAIAFWPSPVDRGAHRPITSILARLHAHGMPGWIDYGLVEFTANIVLFVPVGLLGVVLLGSARWWVAVLAGFAASGLIELGQLVFLPARYATVMDVLANTSGAALGALLALLLLAAIGSRSPTPGKA